MGVGTNLGRKSVAGWESRRSVVTSAAVAQGGGGGGGACWRRERSRRRGRRNGGKGKEDRCLFMRQWPSLWTTSFGLMRSMAVVHNGNHWQFFKFNSRRCERRPLTNAHLTSNVAKRTSFVIFLKPELNSVFLFQNILFTSKTPFMFLQLMGKETI